MVIFSMGYISQEFPPFLNSYYHRMITLGRDDNTRFTCVLNIKYIKLVSPRCRANILFSDGSFLLTK